MLGLRFAVVTALLALVSATAFAADAWKTVSIDEDPAFTISVPAAAKVDGRTDANSLMFFSVTAGLHGDAWCAMTRADYPKDATPAQFAAGLATPRRETFCQPRGDTIKDVHILGSKSLDHHGVQGAICAASYTDTAAKAPGQVQSNMILAAPRSLYHFSCTVEGESQFDAEGYWTVFWAEKVGHMQESLRLPK